MKVKVYVVDVRVPLWLRRVLVFGIVPSLIVGLGALAYATAVNGQPDFVDGDLLTAFTLNVRLGALQEQINTVSSAVAAANTRITALSQRTSAVRAVSTAQQSMPDGVPTTVIYNTPQFDLGSEYKKETGIFTAATDGLYAISCQLEIFAPADTDISVSIVVNNAAMATGGLVVAAAGGIPTVSTVLQLHASDQVRCDGRQSGGNTARTLNGVADRNFISIVKL